MSMFALWYISLLINGRFPKLIDCERKRWLEDAIVDLLKACSCSLLKKHLTRAVFDKIKARATAHGSTLKEIIQQGICNPDCFLGVVAPDAYAYDVFEEFFNPLIEEFHMFSSCQRPPSVDFGNPLLICNFDPANRHAITTRIWTSRNVEGYPFTPSMSEKDFREVENSVKGVLLNLDGDLRGVYHGIEGMGKGVAAVLRNNRFLFDNCDKLLRDANVYAHWPAGRGIFNNIKKTLLIWVNEQDHLRICSMQNGGDLQTVYSRLVNCLQCLEQGIPFARHERLGYVCLSPANLGTALHLVVSLHLPSIACKQENMQCLHEFCVRNDLTCELICEKEGIFSLSNTYCLGMTEFHYVKEFADSIVQLIRMERSFTPPPCENPCPSTTYAKLPCKHSEH